MAADGNKSPKTYRAARLSMIEEEPICKYITMVGCCCGCCAEKKFGDCSRRDETLPELDVNDPEQFADIMAKHFSKLKENPAPHPNCKAPVQFKMGDKKVTPLRNPDKWCCVLSLMGPRILVLFGIGSFVENIFAAKQAIAGFLLVTLMVSASYVILASCCLCICGKRIKAGIGFKSVLKKSMRIKQDQKNEDEGLNVFRKNFNKIKNTVMGGFRIFCLCRMCRPRFQCVFAKVVVVLIVQDVLLVIAIWIYFTFRFALGTMTWTACSFISWIEELIAAMGVRERMTSMDHEVFSSVDAVEVWKEEVEVPPVESCGCCGCCEMCKPCVSCGCCGCSEMCKPCMSCGGCGCSEMCKPCGLVCTMCKPLCCSFAEVGCELVSDFSGIFTILLKAMLFTDKLLEIISKEGPRAQAPEASAFDRWVPVLPGSPSQMLPMVVGAEPV